MDNRIDERFKLKLQSSPDEGAVVKGDKYRFTVITSQLIRIEYSEEGTFEDRPTQSVWNRNFSCPQYRVIENENKLEIITEFIHLYYLKKSFSPNTLYIDVTGNFSHYNNRWRYGEKTDNLKGTYRTLDMTNGAIPLDDGVLSKNGYSCIDDSCSFILTEDGWVEPRAKDSVDLYFFGYGREYLKCLKDFFKLTGSTPLLPRYTLGNWWSRFWDYSEEELKGLMEKFRKEDIPFSVCVLDMDWHLVNIDPKYGSGWTGYTFNKALFPQPEAFMRWLHEHNLKTTLNLHPADGVKAHEAMYEPMAKELGIDYEKEDPIPFNVTSPEFLNAYFKYLHHPLEEQGVDFWWIDWQQGEASEVEGLDPLWMLNHYHFFDSKREGKRPLIFSRYAGVGSHRYPIGFSGDTYVTWKAYQFQPYFTATASNIGYCWWSHDIGGHYKGERDDELSARWVQFGTFSPIMRLHSSKNNFMCKEPWRYAPEVMATMKEHLRLRHQLVPYVYTMNHRLQAEGIPLIQPMYYAYPYEESAYQVPNQYLFGSELMVSAITEKINPKTKLAETKVWLPEGEWIDFFDGTIYKGGRNLRMFRPLDRQVVLAKAGGILPLARHIPHQNSIANPKDLDIHVFGGASNSFELYEDDGISMAYEENQYAVTKMELEYDEKIVFTLHPAKGDTICIPDKRNIRLMLRGLESVSEIRVAADEKAISFQQDYDEETHTLIIIIQELAVTSLLRCFIKQGQSTKGHKDLEQKVYKLLDQAAIEYEIKDHIYKLVKMTGDAATMISELQSMQLDAPLYDALLEICLH